ncbi:hypothetical protein Tco_1446635 [Tanacetum coccineum]
MRMVMMMKKIVCLNNAKGRKKWQSMVLDMKIEEIMCSKKEIPARFVQLALIRLGEHIVVEFEKLWFHIEGFSSHGFHERGFDGLEKQHWIKRKLVKKEKRNWSEVIHHHFHKPCDQVKEMRMDDFSGEVQLHTLVDEKKIIINESIVRRDLQLEDAEGIDCLPNSTIFKQLALMGAKTTAWNEFSSTMPSTIICLATNQKFNFSKYIFESMVKKLDNVSGNFLMYSRFVQVFVNQQLDGLPSHKRIYDAPSHTKKIFGNMRRVGKAFSVPQPSGPTNIVADEAVHKKLADSLVRASTTASSLEAELDSGNITKTQSKATPNEVGSQGTTSGGGPRRQETMGDTVAQTRFENVYKLSNDPLLARGFLIWRRQRPLKRRVKKLEQKKRSRSHGLKRLHKVDEDITLVSVQDDADKEMFDVDTLDGEEVFVIEQNENVVEEVVDAAQVSTAATTVTITTEEITLAQALADLKITKPKAKGIAFREPSESTTTIFSQQLQDKERNGNAIAEEEKIDEANIALTEEWDDIQAKIKADREFAQRLQAGEQEELNKPPIQAQQRKIMCTYLKNMEGKKLKDLKNKSFDSIQKMFDRAFKRVNTFVDFRIDLVEGSLKRAGEELE